VNDRVRRFYEALEKQQEPPGIELNFDTLEFQFSATQEGLQFPEGMPAWKYPQYPPSQDDSIPGPTTPPIFRNDVELQQHKKQEQEQEQEQQREQQEQQKQQQQQQQGQQQEQEQEQHTVPSDLGNLKYVRNLSPSIIQYEVYGANVLLSPTICNLKVVEQASPGIPFEVYDPEFLPSSATCYHCQSGEHLAHTCFKRPRYFKSFNIVVRERKCMYTGEF
jgi:hypothetical protein